MKVLVVDDEALITEFVSMVLEDEKCDVSIAENGKTAFRLASVENFDLIFLDVKMPEWDGVEAIKGLALVDKHPKFVLMSGYGMDLAKDELTLYENVIGYLTKPFNAEQVVQYLNYVRSIKPSSEDKPRTAI